MGESIEQVSLMFGESRGAAKAAAGDKTQPILLRHIEGLPFAGNGGAPAIDLEKQPRCDLRVQVQQFSGEIRVAGEEPAAGELAQQFEVVVGDRQ